MALTFVEESGHCQSHRLWASEYQPSELKDVIGNEMTIETINTYLKNDQMLNLILCGPNGCGKTTVAKILVKKYLGPYYQSCHLDVIGSIDRGKNVVSEKTDKKKTNDKSSYGPNIINFIKKTAFLPDNKCKFVVIYDFDCMTTEAQMALRRIIEIYSKKVRFIFICNDLNGIIEAIQSRAIVLKFNTIDIDQIKNRLKTIAQLNHIEMSDEIYDAISIISNGDLKQAINYLQVFCGCNQKNIENFYHIFNIPSITTVKKMIDFCLSQQETKAFEIMDKLVQNGYNISDILDIIIKVLSYEHTLNDKQKIRFIEETTKIICVNEVSPSVIHLYNLIVQFIKSI